MVRWSQPSASRAGVLQGSPVVKPAFLPESHYMGVRALSRERSAMMRSASAGFFPSSSVRIR